MSFKTAVKKAKRKPKLFEFKDFGSKSIDFIDNADASINIQHGAIRSGKTISSIVAWLDFIANHPYDEFLESGKTRTSLYRNVLRPQMSIMESLGIEYEYRPNDGYIRIEDNTVWLVGFAHEGIAEIIRGMTIAGWKADELNTYSKNNVEEALDRLSIEGSRAFWDMNPDSPNHYIYKEYITNESLLEARDVKTWHYTLYDNPALAKEYIERLERRYPKGTVGYKRKILGLWVVAEGTIYNQFMEGQHTFSDPPYDNYDSYVLSMDYGPGNVSVIGLFGIKRSNQGNHYHLLDEFYYDVTNPNNNGKQLTDSELADEGLKLMKERPLKNFYTPHDASSFRAVLKKKTYKKAHIPISTYTPDVLNDIQVIQELLSSEEPKFKISSKCENSINQAQSYSWDPKSQALGEDKPLKVDDHCPDMWRGAILGSRNLINNPFTESKQKYESSKWK